MRYLVLGDCHGHFEDVSTILHQAVQTYKIDACIQVGDFGFYPLVFDKFRDMKFVVPVYAIDGNHEDHWWIMEQNKVGNVKKWKDKHNIIYIPRGNIWEIDGCKFGFLGGAMNVDRPQYGSVKNGTSNFASNHEVKEAAKKFNELGKLDFLITHSCPHSIGVRMMGDPYFIPAIRNYIHIPYGVDTGPLDDCGEASLTLLWNLLKEKPANFIFGHFHKLHQKQVGDTLFTCVGASDSAGGHNFATPFVIDTQAKTFEAFPHHKLLNAKGMRETFVMSDEEIKEQCKIVKKETPE